MNTLPKQFVRVFVYLVITILFLSTVPIWIAQDTIDIAEPNCSGSVTDTTQSTITESEINRWSELTKLANEEIYDEQAYLAQIAETLGTELTQKRLANTKTFISQDNQVTYQIFPGNVHFRNSIDQWQEFNNVIKTYNMKPVGSDDKYAYANEDNTIHTYFGDSYTQSNSILTTVGDDFLAWEPHNMAYVDSTNTEIELSQPSNQKPIVRNNKILYPGTHKNTADLFTITDHTLKHEMILDILPSLSSINNVNIDPDYLPSDLVYSGILSPSEDLELFIAGNQETVTQRIITNEDLELRTKVGTNELILPKPVAYELNDQFIRTSCNYLIEPLGIGNNYKLSIQTPYSWLADPMRNYPIVIDPTVTFKIQPTEQPNSNDTFISMATTPQRDYNFGEADTLIVGGNNYNDSALIRFDVASLPASDISYETATLKLTTKYEDGYETADINISVHKMKQSWVEGTGTKNIPTNDGANWKSPTGSGASWTDGDGGSFELSFVDNPGIGATGEEFSFDVSDLVQPWRSTPTTNYGMYLKVENRLVHTEQFKAFHSSKAGNVVFRPKLEVSFLNTPPSVKPLNKYVWKEDWPNTRTIIPLSDHFSDADHDVLDITLWTGTEWGDDFDCPIFTADLIKSGNPNNPVYNCQVRLKKDKYGTQKITFNATDKISFSEAQVTIQVESVNDPPKLKYIGNQDATEEEYLIIPLEVTDVEGHTVTWAHNITHTGLMSRFEILKDPEEPNNQYKKQLQYYPENVDVPRIHVRISVWDSQHDEEISPSIDWENVTLNITNVNDKPLIFKVKGTLVTGKTDYTISAEQDKKKSLVIQAYDEDIINGDDLTFSIEQPSKADKFEIIELTAQEFFSTTNELLPVNVEAINLEFTPENSQVGEYFINLKVEDNDDESDSIRINYNILNTNDPPEIVSKSKSEPGYGPQYTNRDFINFSCVVDDPDLHIPDTEESLNVTWYTNISSKRTVLGYGDEVKLQEFKAGEYEIEILVTDNSGLQAYDFFDLKIEKSITLHKETDFTYLDNSTLDDVEYSYNADTKKFTITQGGFGEIDLVQLGAYYDENTDNIVIKLKFDGIIDTPVPYNVRVYLVKPHHIEPEQNYDVEFSADFYDRGLYTPPQGKYYGFFTNSDGEFKDDEFIIEYSLADLEEGVDGKFYPLESGFGLFAFVKWSEDEDLGRIKNYRYDSIGHVSAYAPPPGSVKNDDGSDSSDAGAINSSSMLIIIIIVILIVVLLIIFSVIKKKKGKSEKEVIDFSSATGPSRAPVPQQQIPQMFMSPFEQQFMGGPGAGAPSQPGQMPMPGPMMTPPPGSGGPGMQPGMQQQPQQRPQQTIPTPMPMQQQQMQRPQLPPGQGPQQQPKQRIPGTTPSTSPSPSTSTPGPGQMPVKGPTQKTPQQQQQPKPKQ